MGKVDLHIHTNFSADGEFTPRQILDFCKSLELNTIAITDHNCIRGVGEALEYGKQLQIDVIPGIEIDCTYQSIDLHLLGYFIDIHNQEFDNLEINLNQQMMDAFPRMIFNLKKVGIEVNEEEILTVAQGKVICGELIGEALLNKKDSEKNEFLRPYLKGGHRSNNPYLNFYLDYFAQGKAAYVPMKYMHLIEAVNMVKKSGGIPVLAHPGHNLKNHMPMVEDILKEGVLGIEVFSNYHTPEQTGYFLEIAKNYKAVITCGSDFHGKNKPSITIGECHCSIVEQLLLKALYEFER